MDVMPLLMNKVHSQEARTHMLSIPSEIQASSS